MANVAPLDIHVTADAFATSFASLLALKVNKNPKYGAADARFRAVAELSNFYDDFVIVAQGILRFHYTGTGSPEGVVEAPVGSVYIRTDGAAGTTWYRKETGTDATGWIDAATFGGASPVVLVGDGSGAPVMRMRKAAASEAALQFYSDQTGTQQRRGDIALTASEDVAIRVYNSAGTLVATWTFFSDADTQFPASLIFGNGVTRIASHATQTPIGTQSAQPTSLYLQRDSNRRWYKKSGSANTGWHPELMIPPQIQTTDATVTTIATFPMQDNSAVQITADVTAKTNGVAGCKTFKMVGLARRHSAGGATLVGTPQDLTGGTLADAALATAVVTIDCTSNDLRVRVTGVAATTINWNVAVRFSESRDTV